MCAHQKCYAETARRGLQGIGRLSRCKKGCARSQAIGGVPVVDLRAARTFVDRVIWNSVLDYRCCFFFCVPVRRSNCHYWCCEPRVKIAILTRSKAN